MKRYIIPLLALVLVCSCNKAPEARISATVAGIRDTAFVLERLNFNTMQTVDTIAVDEQGCFSYKVKLKNSSPAFYYLRSGENLVASMILLPGDDVTVNISPDGYDVIGSEESLNLKVLNDNFNAATKSLSDLAGQYVAAKDDATARDINAKMSRVYVDYKKSAIKHALTHPHSITAATVLFQKFNENLPVFDQISDVILFRNVYDSLKTVYPESEYLSALLDEIDSREKLMDISNKFGDAKAISFPEVALPDVNGETKVLSELEGNVIILSFWSVAQEEHKMFNNELMDIYGKYHDGGLEIYQVSLDVDKPAWAATVKNQNLPWINVNDGLGLNCPAVMMYRIDHVPSMFVIGRDGSFIGRDVFDASQLEKVIASAI